MFKKILILGMVLGFAGSSFAKGTKTETKSLWGVRAEDLKVKEIIEVVPGTQATKEEILSPDGKKEARIKGNEIVIKELKKGTPTEVRIKQEKEIKKVIWLPDNRKIAYITGDELWTVDVKGRDKSKIAKLANFSHILQLSPNGEDLAYCSKDDKGAKTEVVDMRTGKKWVVFGGEPCLFRWLPDGGMVFIKVGYSSYLINKDGSKGIDIPGIYADLSPDGKKIVYTCWYGGYRLWIMDLETKETKMLTPWGTRPSWSPDGKKIAYDTDLEISVGAFEEEGIKVEDALDDIWIINADGTGKKNLTNTEPFSSDLRGHEYELRGVEWCPEWIDNETIRYEDETTSEVFIIKLERR